MQKKLFRLFRFIHSWGGITIALLLLLSSLSGSLLIWKNDYVLLSFPEVDRQFNATTEVLAHIAVSVEAQFPSNEILQISFPAENFPLTKVALTGSRYAYLDNEGVILDQWLMNERWEEWLYDLHHRYLLDDLGLTLVGLMGLAMIILLFAGVLAFWPLRRSFGRGFWPRSMKRQDLLLSHRNIGIIEALPLLLTLVTGVLLVFTEQAENYLLEPFRGEEYSMDFADGLDTISGAEAGEWLPVMQRSLASFPDARIRSAEVPNDFYPYRIVGLQQAGELNPSGLSMIYVDVRSGRMELRIDSQRQHISERLYAAAYPLHTARFDSLLYKLFLTLSGLLISVLCVLGLSSFIKKYMHLNVSQS